MYSVVKRDLGIEATCEESLVGESKTLGCINVQIQVPHGQIRTLRDAIEVKYESNDRRKQGNGATDGTACRGNI